MSYRSIISLMPKTAPVDADAQAFLTAAGITDPTISGAINTLVVQMKADNIWTKMKAIYPMVGGTASTHKFNLKDPRDLDAAFRIVWSGGITHSANGVLGNAINGYGDTKISPSSVLGLNSTHISYYSRTNLNKNEVEIGARNGSSILFIQTRQIGSVSDCYMNDSSFISLASPDSLGFYIGNRITSGTKTFWKNGNKIHTQTTVATARPSSNIYILANNNGGVLSEPSLKQCAFASIGDGLSDTEAANFYTAVQALQTSLSRQI